MKVGNRDGTHPGRRDRGAARRRFAVTAKRDVNAAKLTGYIDRILAEAKPLTDEQRTRLAELLRHRDDRFRQPKGLITADASAATSRRSTASSATPVSKIGPPIRRLSQGLLSNQACRRGADMRGSRTRVM